MVQFTVFDVEKIRDFSEETKVYSRIVKYHCPVKNWNDGKKSECFDRKEFAVGPATPDSPMEKRVMRESVAASELAAV